MVMLLEKTSTVSGKGQTTVPVEIRQVLGVAAGDRLTYRAEGDGTVLVRKTDSEEDPAICAFLEFLEEAMRRRPEAIRPVSASLERRLREITAETRIDRVNDRIAGDVEL